MEGKISSRVYLLWPQAMNFHFGEQLCKFLYFCSGNIFTAQSFRVVLFH